MNASVIQIIFSSRIAFLTCVNALKMHITWRTVTVYNVLTIIYIM